MNERTAHSDVVVAFYLLVICRLVQLRRDLHDDEHLDPLPIHGPPIHRAYRTPGPVRHCISVGSVREMMNIAVPTTNPEAEE